MSPGPVTQGAAAGATILLSQRLQGPGPTIPFDDLFHGNYMAIIERVKKNARASPITHSDRRQFIMETYNATDTAYFDNRALSNEEFKIRALTFVFAKILAEEPWSDQYIRHPTVERKLARYEMHPDSVALAKQHGITLPKEAITAAREAQIELSKGKGKGKTLRGPWDDIEIIYIAGTVSSSATAKIKREEIYPISASSIANVLQNHICRDVTRPYDMAKKFVTCTDTEELKRIRKFACDVVDFAPHLLDTDNLTLVVILLVIPRSDIVKRFEENGIRIEGSTLSHRRAECLNRKFGWKTTEDRKPFDTVANEFQTRVKNALLSPSSRGSARPYRSRASGSHQWNRKSTTPTKSITSVAPPVGLFASPYPKYSPYAPRPVGTKVTKADFHAAAERAGRRPPHAGGGKGPMDL